MRQEEFYSVGDGGYFQSLGDACAYLTGLPTGMDEIADPDLVKGGITIGKNSDLMNIEGGSFSVVEPGDFIVITGAHISNGQILDATKLFCEVTNGTATEARLVSGVNNGVVNASWKIIRPRYITLQLLNQVHDVRLMSQCFLPDYLNLTIVGDDGASIVGDNNDGQKIKHKRFNSVRCCNFSIEGVREFVYLNPTNITVYDSSSNACEGLMEFADVTVNNPHVSVADPLGAKIIISNIKGEAMIRNPIGDDILVTDCFLKTTSNYRDSTDCFDFAHRYNYQTTKKTIIANCHFQGIGKYAIALSCGALGGNLYKKYHIYNCYVGVTDINTPAVKLRYGDYVIANCVIDGAIDLDNSSSVVSIINTRRPDGSLPSFINSQNATIKIDGVPRAS